MTNNWIEFATRFRDFSIGDFESVGRGYVDGVEGKNEKRIATTAVNNTLTHLNGSVHLGDLPGRISGIAQLAALPDDEIVAHVAEVGPRGIEEINNVLGLMFQSLGE